MLTPASSGPIVCPARAAPTQAATTDVSVCPRTRSSWMRVWAWVSMRPGTTFQVYQPGAAQIPGLIIFGGLAFTRMGQKTGAFEVVDVLGFAPDFHVLPVGNAGNYTAYSKGYKEDLIEGRIKALPKMWGFQAEGSAPFSFGNPVKKPDTIATAIRIGNPASYDLALAARAESEGQFGYASDAEILWMHRFLSQEVGVFVEPSSATGAAGLFKHSKRGEVPAGSTIVVTVTGHGLKDPMWALKTESGKDIKPQAVANKVEAVAERLGLTKK